MNLGYKFENKTFLITGANGFIGSRIIERLSQEYYCHIKALVHSTSRATRIARFDIELIQGDVLDKCLLHKITKDAEYVIHCAFGNTDNVSLNRQITVEGTRNISLASLVNKVKRLIHFSTMSVYGYPLPPICDEKTPYTKVVGDFYNNDKITAEKIIQNYIKKGLPAVILQPTIVYGPYASIWTVDPINKINVNGLFLVQDGQGLTNPLYIDNLIDAVFLALTKGGAIGETFIISDGKSIRWKEFFAFYQSMVPKKKLSNLSLFNKYKLEIISFPLLVLLILRKSLSHFGLFKTPPDFAKKIIAPFYRRARSMKDLSTNKNRQLFFQDKTTFDINKARRILGYSPRIALPKGMKLTEEWLRYARII